MNWDDLRIFLAVARSKSLTVAARTLSVNQSTVSRRLAAMEQHLGVRLLDRSAATHALTPAGLELFDTALTVEERFAEIQRRVIGRDSQLRGRLRVTCTDNFANSYLAPHLARFAAIHPEIDLEVITRYQHVSLARREADVAIRTTLDPPESLVGRRLFRFALAVYGAADYVSALPPEPNPSELVWIGWDSDAYNRLMITSHFPNANIRHRVDSLLEMRALAREGLGVTVLGCFAGDCDVGLRRVYAEPIIENAMDLWILSHPDVRRAARVRAFTRFISETFMADRDLFQGQRPIL